MYWLRSSNSLLVMMRLFTLATISSRMAARAGRGSGAASARVRARVRTRSLFGGRESSVLVLAHIVERHDGAVDADLGLLLEIGDVALESLLSLLLEQLQLRVPLDVVEVGRPGLHLLHHLEDEVALGVLDHRADLPRLEREERGPQLDRQLLLAVRPGLAVVRGDRVLARQGLEARGSRGSPAPCRRDSYHPPGSGAGQPRARCAGAPAASSRSRPPRPA